MNILNKRAWFAKHPKAGMIIQRKDLFPVRDLLWYTSDFLDKTCEGAELGDFVLAGVSGDSIGLNGDPHLHFSAHVKAKDQITYIATYWIQEYGSTGSTYLTPNDHYLDAIIIPKEISDDIEDNKRPYWFMKNPKAKILAGSVTLGNNPGNLNNGVTGMTSIGSGPNWEFSQQKFFTKEVPVPGCKPGDFVLVSVSEDIGLATITGVAKEDGVWFKMYTNYNAEEGYPAVDTELTPNAKIRCLVIPQEAIPELKDGLSGQVQYGTDVYDQFKQTPIYRFGGENDLFISYSTNKYTAEQNNSVTISAGQQKANQVHAMNAKRSFNPDMNQIKPQSPTNPYTDTATESLGVSSFHLTSVNVPPALIWNQGVDNFCTISFGFILCARHPSDGIWHVNKTNGNSWKYSDTLVRVFNTLIDDNDPDNSPDWWRLYYEGNSEVADRVIYHKSLYINLPDDYSLDAKFIYGDYE